MAFSVTMPMGAKDVAQSLCPDNTYETSAFATSATPTPLSQLICFKSPALRSQDHYRNYALGYSAAQGKAFPLAERSRSIMLTQESRLIQSGRVGRTEWPIR